MLQELMLEQKKIKAKFSFKNKNQFVQIMIINIKYSN